ncbi:hypothetical protein BGZ82_008773 [Podila clonocystis]|nr:hypothetical protein BGZ82_008773 [Podila clonocystis]
MLRQTTTLSIALQGIARTHSLSTSSRLSLTASRAYASTSTPRRSHAQAVEESHHHDPHHQQHHQTNTSSASPGNSGSPGTGAGSGLRVPYYTRAELETMTLQDLRALCKENGLKVSGRKKELVNRTFKYVHDHHQHLHPTPKEATKTGAANTGTERTAHIKDQLEWEARLQKDQVAQMKHLEKEVQAREKREIEKRAREAQEKEAASVAKREKYERELRAKEQHERETRLKKEQHEKEMRAKEQQAKEARLQQEQHEKELRVKKEQEKEARLKKEKHEHGLRLMEQQQKEARLAKEKHEHELRLKERHEKEARLKKEQHEKEARLKKEQREKEVRLAEEKHEHDLRLREAHEKEARMKTEQQEKEALIKKELHEKELHEKQQLLLKADEEKRKGQMAEAAKRVQAHAVGQEHQSAIKSTTKGHTSGSASQDASSRRQSNQDEWAKEKLPLGTRAAGLAMGLGIMAWFLSGKRDRWAEAQEQAKAQERARLHGEKPKE